MSSENSSRRPAGSLATSPVFLSRSIEISADYDCQDNMLFIDIEDAQTFKQEKWRVLENPMQRLGATSASSNAPVSTRDARHNFLPYYQELVVVDSDEDL